MNELKGNEIKINKEEICDIESMTSVMKDFKYE